MDTTEQTPIKDPKDRPLKNDRLYGAVDLKWYGDSSFKVHFLDGDNEHRNIYIDMNIENKDCPADDKKDCPNDADLVLVSHGQFKASMHAPMLINGGKKKERKLVCNTEIATYMS